MPKSIERQGVATEPMVHHYPQVTSGVCEFCGVIDPKQPSTVQYTLCHHFKDLGELRCSYCDENRDPSDVIYHETLNITDHPDHPDKIVVVCGSYNCSQKHQARFKR